MDKSEFKSCSYASGHSNPHQRRADLDRCSSVSWDGRVIWGARKCSTVNMASMPVCITVAMFRYNSGSKTWG